MKRTTNKQSTKQPQPRPLDSTELAHVTGGNEVMKKRHEMSM